jgi:hypothetical protein
MKKRAGFVSNSSSSSFILSSEKTKHLTIKMELSLDDLITKIINTQDELIEYMFDEYCLDTKNPNDWDERTKEKYKKFKWESSKGKKLIIGDCSNEDDNSLSQLLYNKGFPMLMGDNYEVVQNTL